MNDPDKNKLLYRPKLRPEREYLSDGEIIDFPLVPLQLPDEADDTPTKIVEDLKEIEEIYHMLPEDVQHMKKSITKLKQRIMVAFPDGTYTPPKNIQKTDLEKGTLPDIINYYDVAIHDNPDLINLPHLFPQMNNVVLKVEQPRTLVQIIQDAYARDQIELEKYYIQKLQMIMQKYFQQMMMIMADSGVASIDDLTKDFDGDFVKIPANKSLEHLRDFIVRSQVRRNQAARMFHKTHSTDKTLMHMRSWHAANEQRKRYYSENYKDSSTFTDSHSNSLLRESRAAYDTAYDSSLYDMYKYLNSSVMVTNDILDATVKEAQAKTELLKNGVDIYAVDQSEVEFAKLATDSGQLGDGKGSGFDDAAKSEEKDDTKKSEDTKTTEQATDAQYENDVKYLMSQGYDKAAADAELAKLPQYKERLGKKDETAKEPVDKKSSSSSSAPSKTKEAEKTICSGNLWNDLVATAAKEPFGKITASIANNKELGEIIDTKVLNDAVTKTAQDTIKNIGKNIPNVLTAAGILALMPKNAASKKQDSKRDQSKYPEYNRIDYDKDDVLTQRKKRVAQLKQDISELDNQITKIKKERQETGKSTLRHNDLVSLSNSRSKLLKELAKLSS